jgi:hypothetical protein
VWRTVNEPLCLPACFSLVSEDAKKNQVGTLTMESPYCASPAGTPVSIKLFAKIHVCEWMAKWLCKFYKTIWMPIILLSINC